MPFVKIQSLNTAAANCRYYLLTDWLTAPKETGQYVSIIDYSSRHLVYSGRRQIGSQREAYRLQPSVSFRDQNAKGGVNPEGRKTHIVTTAT